MSLYDDLVLGGPDGESKMSVHGFCAALRFWEDGGTDRATLEFEFGIAELDADLDFLKSKYTASADKPAFIAKVEQLLILGETHKFGLDTKATFQTAVNAIG